nr:hypothetical protein [Nonlabens ulvanivorans]
MKNIIFYLLTLLVSLPASAQQFTWALRGGGSINWDSNPNDRDEYEHIRDIVIDSQNNYYFLAKVSSGVTDLNGTAFTNYNQPAGGADTFLFSTDCDGVIRWQKVIGGWAEELTQHLSIDTNDNIYVSGLVFPPRGSNNEGFIHFDSDVVINSNLVITDPGPHNKSMYLIKYDSFGNFQWLQSPQTDNAAFQEFQKSYTFGHYTDSNNVTHWLMTMGAGTHINGAYTATNDDYAVFRFDNQGNYLGNTPVNLAFTGGRLTYAANLAMDETLNRYYISVARSFNFNDSIDFMGSPVTNNVALAAIDVGTGNLVWRIENTGGNKRYQYL